MRAEYTEFEAEFQAEYTEFEKGLSAYERGVLNVMKTRKKTYEGYRLEVMGALADCARALSLASTAHMRHFVTGCTS